MPVSGCPSPYFCPRRRFAAYHEQGQAPAPHPTSTITAHFQAAQNATTPRQRVECVALPRTI
nr:hypothetical protein [uncultured Kingella sp.]